MWKVYFWFCVIQFILNIRMAKENFIPAMDIPNWVLMGVGLVGLWGFVYQKKVYIPLLWKLLLPIYFVWTLVYLAWIWTLQDPEIPDKILTYSLAGVFALALPQFWALYRYGFKYQRLWDTDGN